MSIKITALSTGTLQLKPTFLEGSPSHGGAFGLIQDLRRDEGWTVPLPMWSWVIETTSELILIDAGARPGAGGGVTRTRFQISEDEALVPQLAERGFKPGDFDRVLLTHLHGDHVGALAAFDPRRVWVSRPEWEPVAHFPGSLLRPLKAPVYRGFRPMVFDFNGPAVFGFRASCPITTDNSILALPTPGHTAGHTSFVVRRGEGDVLIAGDVTYDLSALYGQCEQGFIEDVEKHRHTLARVLALVQGGVAYLPSHDPDAPSRLARHSGTVLAAAAPLKAVR